MCGIFVYFGTHPLRGKQKKCLCKKFQKIKHRGPDQSVIKYYGDNVMFGFHRLQIVDPTSDGMQPFESSRFVCVVNGEIYNYKDLQVKLKEADYEYKPKSHSDCEVVVHLFEYYFGHCSDTALSNLCKDLDGEYAFVIYDTVADKMYFGVDPLRVRPLFLGQDQYKNIYFSSEQKSLSGGTEIIPVMAGVASSLPRSEEIGFYRRSAIHHFSFDDLIEQSVFQDITYQDAVTKYRELMIENLRKKLCQRDREFGFLLSGGVDSSLVCALAARELHPIRIKTFTVAFSKDAPDLIAARKVAQHIDSIHHEIICSYEDGIAEIKNVIRFGETYDQTSVRASIPMRLALVEMKKLYPNLAIVYSGEVADEELRGYLYNFNSPSPSVGRLDAIERCKDITYFDGLRADRMVSSVSCELRLPFFSRKILDFLFTLPPQYLDPTTCGIEKKLLRDAFDKDENGKDYLPLSILWRKKDAFSDATSKSSGWKDVLKEYVEEKVTNSRYSKRSLLYPHNTPQTKEDFYYREIFDEFGYEPKTIPYKWMPKWCGELTDSSATVLSVYNNAHIVL